MKKFLVGAVATAALLTPAVAAADTNAVVGVQYGNTEFDGDDVDGYGITGAFSHDMNNGWVLQFDGAASRVDFGGTDLDNSYAALHYGLRNEGHALAGFVSMDDFFGISGTGFGVEGQLYLNNIVLGGSLGHLDYGDADFGATSLQVDGAYYITPNFSINALVAQTEGSDDLDEEWTSYGVGGEYRFHGPLSVSAGWRTDDFDTFGDAETWTVGLTFDLGTDSLHDRATSGPSLQGARNITNAVSGLLP